MLPLFMLAPLLFIHRERLPPPSRHAPAAPYRFLHRAHYACQMFGRQQQTTSRVAAMPENPAPIQRRLLHASLLPADMRSMRPIYYSHAQRVHAIAARVRRDTLLHAICARKQPKIYRVRGMSHGAPARHTVRCCYFFFDIPITAPWLPFAAVIRRRPRCRYAYDTVPLKSAMLLLFTTPEHEFSRRPTLYMPYAVTKRGAKRCAAAEIRAVPYRPPESQVRL